MAKKVLGNLLTFSVSSLTKFPALLNKSLGCLLRLGSIGAKGESQTFLGFLLVLGNHSAIVARRFCFNNKISPQGESRATTRNLLTGIFYFIDGERSGFSLLSW